MFDKNLMKLPGMRAVMAALVVLALLQAACIVAWAYGLTGAVCTMRDGLGVEAAVPHLVLFAVCFVLLYVVRFAQETMLDRYSVKRARALRDDLLKRTFEGRDLLSLRAGAARVSMVANDGIDEVQAYLRIMPPKIVGMAAISAPLLVCVFVFDWVSGVILIVMFPVVMYFMRLIGLQARDRSERQYASYTRLADRFMDTLRGLPVIKAFGSEEVEASSVYANSEGVRHATMRTMRMATLSSAMLDLCATFGVGAVAIMLAFRLMDGSLPLFIGLIVIILAPEYFSPIRLFAADYHASLDGKNALSAVLEYLDYPDAERGLPREERVLGGDHDAGQAPDIRCGEAGPPLQSFAFEGVGYRYDDGSWGVRDLSFTVGARDKVGIVGKSGSGKSTVANLCAGFTTPTAGRIVVDGLAVDLASDAWKRQVRYIPQAPYIFRASLEENIRFYRPQATREAVQEAVHAVGLDSLVTELPDGLDTVVGEGARGLSGGEAHRVALARILVDDEARVIVFDEPTAHLDVETERDLKDVMLAAMEGRLVFFATHRLHWMADMDRVISLDSVQGEGVGSR